MSHRFPLPFLSQDYNKDIDLVISKVRHSFIASMKSKKNELLHRPIFTILHAPIMPNEPRRMAGFATLPETNFKETSRHCFDVIYEIAANLGYKPHEPVVLFNVDATLAQEPHEDGHVNHNQFQHPALSVIANPLVCNQGIWIAPKSHLRDGPSYLKRIAIPAGHALFLRHDTCHAGMGNRAGDRLVRLHVNLVHESDPRTEFNFSEVVIPTIRLANGARIKFPSLGTDFTHVQPFVNHTTEEDAQAKSPSMFSVGDFDGVDLSPFDDFLLQQSPDLAASTGSRALMAAFAMDPPAIQAPPAPVENPPPPSRKRTLMTAALEDSYRMVDAQRQQITEETRHASEQVSIIRARLDEIRRLLAEQEHDLAARVEALARDEQQLALLNDKAEGLEAAMEVIARQ